MTTFLQRLAVLATLATLALGALPAGAGPGHDHGEAPAPTGGTTGQPRWVAESEAFEAVGVLSGRQLLVYLDRAASNEPVAGARLALQLGEAPLEVQATGPGLFEARLSAAQVDAVAHQGLPLTATVQAGAESDLLVGDLAGPAGAPVATGGGASGWLRWGAAALAGLLGAGVLLWGGSAWRARRAGGLA